MSKEDALRFLKKLEESGSTRPSDESVDAFLSFAAEQGYEFTAEDFSEMLRALPQPSGGARAELTEDALTAVAGGVGFRDLRAYVPSSFLQKLGDHGSVAMVSSWLAGVPKITNK